MEEKQSRFDKAKSNFFKRANEKFSNKFEYGEFTSYAGRIKVKCPTHGWLNTTPASHIRSIRGCCKCGSDNRKITIEAYTKRFEEKFGCKYSFSNYIQMDKLITFICDRHGSSEQLPEVILNGIGCLICKFSDEFEKQLEERFGGKYSMIGVYKGKDQPVEILCRDHGISQYSCPATALRNGSACRSCGMTTKRTQEEYEEEAYLIHANKYTYGKYISAAKHIEIICPNHGSSMLNADSHLRGYGCPTCRQTILT